MLDHKKQIDEMSGLAKATLGDVVVASEVIADNNDVYDIRIQFKKTNTEIKVRPHIIKNSI